MREITLENANFRLLVDSEEDDRGVQMYTKLANDLIDEFESICKDPFVIRIREYKCGDSDPHSYAEISTINANGKRAICDPKKPAMCVKTMQYYAAWNNSNPSENYMEMITIRVYMNLVKPDRSSSDEEDSLIENPLIENPKVRTLLRLACSHYYEKVAWFYNEWVTDYRDAPEIYVKNDAFSSNDVLC